MKRPALFLLLSFAICSQTRAQYQVQKIWETDTILAVPESVLPDKKRGIFYVSLIDGKPWDVDGKGGVGKIDRNGKILDTAWITGLNAPKGMGIYGNKLYVADVTEIVVINIAGGKIENKIKVEGAQALNDITIDSKGTIYISDSQTGIVHRLKNGKLSHYLTGLNRVNGLKAVGSNLYILTAKEVYKADASGKLTAISVLETGGDGIEPAGNGDFIATSWPGYMYYVYANGKKDLLLDTHEQNMNTADIYYDPTKRIIYVPTFFRKSVIAYQLK